MNSSEVDLRLMEEALRLAEAALALGEVPVGALVVSPHGEVISRAHNMRETLKDPFAHAEALAIREASFRVGSWRLEGFALYSTLEPCPMCAGLVLLSRISKVVFGAFDPRMGAMGSLYQLHRDSRLNHRPEVVGGVMKERAQDLMFCFFRGLRAKARSSC